MDKLLSVSDIRALVKQPIRFVTYPELTHFNTWRDLFKGFDNILLLYSDPNINPKVGHWVALNKTKYCINYFDSYGREPDRILEDITYKYKNELCRILYHVPFPIHYNDIKLQDDKSMVCGRYVALFFVYCTDKVEKFVNTLIEDAEKLGITTDQLAYELTK